MISTQINNTKNYFSYDVILGILGCGQLGTMLFTLTIPFPLRSTLFPYTTLFRSPSHLTLSFVPDGTQTGVGASNLSGSLSNMTQPTWEQTILRVNRRDCWLPHRSE